MIGRALDDLHDRAPFLGAGGNVEENHLIGALLVVTDGEFHRVADITQPAGFRASELHAARNLAVMNVQAGNDPSGEHRWKV